MSERNPEAGPRCRISRRQGRRRETTGSGRTPEALGSRVLSGGEFLYRLSAKKRTRLPMEHNALIGQILSNNIDINEQLLQDLMIIEGATIPRLESSL